MVNTQREKYERSIEYLDRLVTDGHVTEESAAAVKEFCDVFDRRTQTPTPSREQMYPHLNQKVRTVASGTLLKYLKVIPKAALWLELTDPQLTTADVNGLLQGYVYGGLDPVEVTDSRGRTIVHGEDTLAHSTAEENGKTLSKFFRWYAVDHETKVKARLIEAPELPENSKEARERGWSKTDLLTPREEQLVWDAAANSRDRALFYTLRWTGMRNTAIRYLRWGDLDFEKGTYRYPHVPDGEGLKHICEPNEERPLVHAEKALRQWAQDHPHSQDSDAHVFTANPEGYGSQSYDPYRPLTETAIVDAMAKLFQKAGIDKPDHPHMMRHLYVTTLKVSWGVDNDHIKWLIGHSDASQVMETTYSHIGTDDHHDAVLVPAGLKQPGDEGSVYRGDTCVNCGNYTDPGAATCKTCGRVQDVNAFLQQKEASSEADAAVRDTQRQAQTEQERDDAYVLAELHDANRDDAQYHDALARQQELLEQQQEAIADLTIELERLKNERDDIDPEDVDVASDALGRKRR